MKKTQRTSFASGWLSVSVGGTVPPHLTRTTLSPTTRARTFLLPGDLGRRLIVSHMGAVIAWAA